MINIVCLTQEDEDDTFGLKTEWNTKEEEADYYIASDKQEMANKFKKWTSDFCLPHTKINFISFTEDLFTYSITK